MPWQDVTRMALRQEFCALALRPDAEMSALCRRYGISRKTGYVWRARAQAGDTDLRDRSHRPHGSPQQTAPAMEARILALRTEHPTWGGRKLQRRLHDLGVGELPAPSTITAILQRHGQIDPTTSAAHRPLQRFEAPTPNDLWQIDFTGDFVVPPGRCFPFAVLDDHSRFLVGLAAGAHPHGASVKQWLTGLFRHYGLPNRILCDNGGPWGTTQSAHRLTALSVWLIRLGIAVIHGRPYHPQTQGKLERLNRTLTADVITRHHYADLAAVQQAFDRFRQCYNYERPHEALALATPISRYTLSRRPFPETLPPIDYAPGDTIRKVNKIGRISWLGTSYNISDALAGEYIAVRPTLIDGEMDVRFCQQVVRTITRHAG